MWYENSCVNRQEFYLKSQVISGVPIFCIYIKESETKRLKNNEIKYIYL